jgi:hypothetical protein
MGLFDGFQKAVEAVSGGLSEFDPTSPTADNADLVRVGGDAVLNIITEGAAGNAFSEGSQIIQDINEITDNAFTAENIGETVESLQDVTGFVPEEILNGEIVVMTEDMGEVANNLAEDLFGGLF